MKYGDFMNKYNLLIDVLELYDEDGCEIDEEYVPDDAEVLGFSNDAGWFDVMVSGTYTPPR